MIGRPTALRTLPHLPVTRQAAPDQRIAFVPLARIVDSESRSHDFDDAFYPIKPNLVHRWTGIAIARRSGVMLPPVELIRDGDEYYVRNGHHRISIAKLLGQLKTEAAIVN